MHILFFFLDGIGLGINDPDINPFSRANTPVMQELLGGRRLILDAAPYQNGKATLLPLNATLGVRGMPQSATGQAVLLTGQNVPAMLGYHFGPWPNERIVRLLEIENLFSTIQKAELRSGFLNAYPPSYFAAVESGKRLYSTIPQAAISAGLGLRTVDDLISGNALSPDFTASGWRDRLGLPDTPILTLYDAGKRLANLAKQYEFSFFEYWLSDYVGHDQDMKQACSLLEDLDQVLAGLFNDWDFNNGLILLTSDHGNMEDLSTRRHTTNPVPGLVIGSPGLRREFSAYLRDLTDIAPAIVKFLT